ncbi:MAG TPA: hypothetical protein VIW03_03410, partial [Anaeromyxobacter sp.]
MIRPNRCRDGRLCFSSVIELSKSLTPENREAVLPRFFHASKREAKAITAELQPVPAPPVRAVVTALPAAASAPPAAPAPVPEPALHPDEVGRPVEAAPRTARPPRTEVEPLTAERSRLHVTVSRRLLEKLAAARDALSHSHPGASEETILEVGLDLILERHAKRRGIGAKPRAKAPAKEAAAVAPPPPRSRSR